MTRKELDQKRIENICAYSLLFMLVLSGASLYFFWKQTNQIAFAAKPGEVESFTKPILNLYPVNIRVKEGSGEKYVRADLTLEFSNPRALSEAKSIQNQAKKVMERMLSGKNIEEIKDKKTQERIKSDLIATIENLLEEGKITKSKLWLFM